MEKEEEEEEPHLKYDFGAEGAADVGIDRRKKKKKISFFWERERFQKKGW